MFRSFTNKFNSDRDYSDTDNKPSTSSKSPMSSTFNKIGDFSERVKCMAQSIKLSDSNWSLCKSTMLFFFGVLLTKKVQSLVNELM